MSSPRPRTPSQRAGDAAETIVAAHLVGEGWSVLARQVRLGRREIDILAVDHGPPAELVIVEARWRRTREYGLPEETFDWRKQRHLRAAGILLRSLDAIPGVGALPRLPIRVDLIVCEPGRPGDSDRIRLRHHRNALSG